LKNFRTVVERDLSTMREKEVPRQGRVEDERKKRLEGLREGRY
jgi:hypothetical protein